MGWVVYGVQCTDEREGASHGAMGSSGGFAKCLGKSRASNADLSFSVFHPSLPPRTQLEMHITAEYCIVHYRISFGAA